MTCQHLAAAAAQEAAAAAAAAVVVVAVVGCWVTPLLWAAAALVWACVMALVVPAAVAALSRGAVRAPSQDGACWEVEVAAVSAGPVLLAAVAVEPPVLTAAAAPAA